MTVRILRLSILAAVACAATLAAPAVFAAAPLGGDQLQIGPGGDEELAAAWAAYEAGDKAKARARYLAAAEHKNRLAQFNLAVMLVAGEGGDPDPRQGLDWLRQAANGGLARAQYSLAQFYERGELVDRSLTEATAWYRKSAEGGWRDAQVSLATQYFLGRGAPLDMAEAARWYEKAADQGDIGAQYIIASMYEKGDGVRLNLERAVFWYHLAAEQGDEVARLKVGEVMGKINAAKSNGSH
jgi:uncharacterized protein